jgi:hypothetical protein
MRYLLVPAAFLGLAGCAVSSEAPPPQMTTTTYTPATTTTVVTPVQQPAYVTATPVYGSPVYGSPSSTTTVVRTP